MSSLHQYIYLFGLLLVGSCSAAFTIYPTPEVVTLPSNGVLKSSVVLSCNIEPPDYLHTSFWITPLGVEVNMTTTHQRYVMQQGRHSQHAMSTTLQISQLSHMDSGKYSCVVNSSNAIDFGMNIIQARSTVQLKLLANLSGIQSNVITTTDEEYVNFTCEVSEYIPPDQDIQWISNTKSLLRNSEKHTISFLNGSQLTAQNGDNKLSPSRLSILTIYNPSRHDSGEYSCNLSGTSQSVPIHLEVNDKDMGSGSQDHPQLSRSLMIKSASLYLFWGSLLSFTI